MSVTKDKMVDLKIPKSPFSDLSLSGSNLRCDNDITYETMAKLYAIDKTDKSIDNILFEKKNNTENTSLNTNSDTKKIFISNNSNNDIDTDLSDIFVRMKPKKRVKANIKIKDHRKAKPKVYDDVWDTENE